MAEKHVFISYKSQDYSEALWLRNVLEANGIHCWKAPSSIPGGSNYAQAIPEAIAECKVFLLLLSSNTQQSVWVSKELSQAINTHKIIMPFMIEECELYKEFNFYLSDVQRYDAFNNKSNAIRKMVTELWGILGIGHAQQEIILPPLIDTEVKPEAKEPTIIDIVSETTTSTTNPPQKTQPKESLARWFLFTYLLCIPAGLTISIICLVRRIKKSDHHGTYLLAKKWAIAGIVVGLVVYIFALGHYDHCEEAMYTSLLGLFTWLVKAA